MSDEPFTLEQVHLKRPVVRRERPEPTTILNVLNLGAGWQSTVLYLMSMRQDEPEHVPLFDAAIFADTQEEPRDVYTHLEWLQSLGGPPILVRTAGSLGNDLLAGKNTTGQRFASIPSFVIGEGDAEPGRTQRQCTKEYKTEVVEKSIRRDLVGLLPKKQIPRNVRINQYMGLSHDEPGRIIRVQERFQAIGWAKPFFPLFDLEMTRADCGAWLKQHAPGRKIPRSACVFCPYHSNEEWRTIRDTDPEGWARALQIDDAIRLDARANRGYKKTMYLHRSCKPLREADLSTRESGLELYQLGFPQECEGFCGV